MNVAGINTLITQAAHRYFLLLGFIAYIFVLFSFI